MLTFTSAAAKRIREQLAKRGHGVGLRLQVKPSGCSGWAYKIDYADDVAADEHRFERDGALIVVPDKSMAALEGVVVDFVGDGFNQRWSFTNPNAEADCGCGESFSLRKSAVSG